MNVLIIDNYDSFVYNLSQYLGELGANIIIYRNDQIDLESVKNIKPDRILISPGPGNPINKKFFGVSYSIIKEVSKNIPTLGVCLGHQGIGFVFGAKIRQAKTLKHGKTSRIQHNERGLFENIKNPFIATRYHSLALEEDGMPQDLEITARSLDDNEIMGIKHKKYPIAGIQCHPESILTKEGLKIMKNFLEGKI